MPRRELDFEERWLKWHGEGFDSTFEETFQRIAEGGAVMSRDLKVDDHKSGGWWNWHPNKTALEYYWHTGKLAIAGRQNFQKIYDLTERVIPGHHYEPERRATMPFSTGPAAAALERLGFATHGEIAAFFDLISPEEAKTWVAAHRDELTEVMIEPAGWRQAALVAMRSPVFPESLGDLADAPARIRVLSPFDPLIRNRNRTERLFGFYYRIEVFVPEPKREYGYYVFPLLEGDKLIGRIDMKAERKTGSLTVKRLWWEKGIRSSTGRMERLEAELARVAKFAGVETVVFLEGWDG